jgi:hypothetical protein
VEVPFTTMTELPGIGIRYRKVVIDTLPEVALLEMFDST